MFLSLCLRLVLFHPAEEFYGRLYYGFRGLLLHGLIKNFVCGLNKMNDGNLSAYNITETNQIIDILNWLY
jgi:hypothetical protein